MSIPLRVLVVEDSPDDADLVLHELRRGGYEPEFERVETAAAMDSALQEKQWDIVLSDYSMPSFSGIDALKLLRSKDLDIPFILISGKIGEETAVDAMKSGANDYVMKGNLERLVPAVERELREAGVRKKEYIAEALLRESEERFRLLAENARDLIYRYVIFPKPGFEYVSPSSRSFTGYSPDEFYADPSLGSKLVHTDDRALFQKVFITTWSSQQPVVMRWIKKDGQVIWVEQQYTLVRNETGEITAVECIARDITERKRAEDALRASEKKYRNLVENAPVGIVINTVGGRAVERNKASLEMHGYASMEEYNRIPVSDLYVDQEDRNRFLTQIQKGVVRDFEVRHKRRDGSVFWISITAIPFMEENGEKQVLVFSEDIDERKRTEEALKESEKKYSALVEQGNDGIIIICDGLVEFANSRMIAITGYTLEKTLGKPFLDFVASSDKNLVLNRYQRRIRGENVPNNYEVSIIADNGNMTPVEISASLINYRGKSADMAIIRDITERKQAEEALKASEEKFRSLLENAPVGISVSQLDGGRLEANKTMLEMHGYSSKEEFLASNVADTYYDRKIRKQYLAALEKGPVQNFELRRKRKDGSMFWASLTSIPYVNSSGEMQFINVVQDITVHKRDEEALKASEERFRSLVENLPVGIGVVTQDGHAIQRNKYLMEIYGYADREEFDATPVSAHYYNLEDRKRFLELGQKGPVKDFEVQLKHKNGAPFWVLMNSITQETPSGEKQIITVIQDITERKKAEEEDLLKARILDSVTDSIILRDFTDEVQGPILYTNEIAYKSHGYTRDEFMKMKPADYNTPESARLVALRIEMIKEKRSAIFEATHRRKDGSTMPAEVHTSVITMNDRKYTLSVMRDITERKKMDEQLMVTSRLASIGELASGVAHEVNNPLTSVIGFSELLLERPLPQDVKEDIGVIRDEAQRAAHVVRNLLTFARKNPTARQSVNINEIIKKVLELRAYEQKVSNINVITLFSSDLPEIMADSFQLRQVFFNLIINAEYFMSEAHHKGILTITTEKMTEGIRASFTDDGPGISEGNLVHLFNPFFTTKPVGKGTGLGLSICHGIVTDHNGKMYVESVPGKGATFIIELPTGNQ